MAGNTMIEQNRLKAIMLRDRKDNPWLPYYLPNERFEVRFADVKNAGTTAGRTHGAAVFSHANDKGEGHRRAIKEWCEQIGVEHWRLGMDAVFFPNLDDATLCKIAFS